MSPASSDIDAPWRWPPMVAVDLGAGSCRVSLLRWSGKVPDVLVAHRFPNGPVQDGDCLRWDLEAICRGVEEGLRKCAEITSEPIASIGVDGWAVDYVRLDDTGRPIAPPHCYRDPRNEAAERAVHNRIGARRLYELTGLQRLNFNTVYQLFADQLAGVPAHLPWVNLPEYVLQTLGARRVSEYTNATHTGLIDLTTRRWCGEIFEELGLDIQAAPELVCTGKTIGRVQGTLAALPAFRETRLIAPACHDTASAIAAVATDSDRWAYISSGTWSLVGTVLDRPCNTEAAFTNNFTNLGAADGGICFHKSVNGMWLIQQCLEAWAPSNQAYHLGEIISKAAQTPSPEGLLEVDDPELMLPGDMPARINAQRRRRGLSPVDEGMHGAPAMASLIFHSLARRYAEVLGHLSETTGKRIEKLHIVGGGAKNRLLNSLTARATGIEVKAGHVECSTIGNFAIQMAAMLAREGWSTSLSDCARQLEQAQYG